ncbi:MAG: rRNA (cytidine-2'-O-)-methyltransferase, partial [Pseudomonadales bacterium]|nr:rRNA (cytidine-2'-O-)-methyltransferase [Pseudomonadales bacterium]
PGDRRVERALAAQVEVTPVPGATSVITALSVSGLPTDRFAFEGFLPSKKGPRQSALDDLRFEARTLVFFEAPHRIGEVIADMEATFGPERRLTVARELTKKFEQVWHGNLAEARERIGGEIPARGEFVLVVAGNTEDRETLDAQKVMEVLLAEHPPRKAADLASQMTGMSKKQLYDLALTLKKKA